MNLIGGVNFIIGGLIIIIGSSMNLIGGVNFIIGDLIIIIGSLFFNLEGANRVGREEKIITMPIKFIKV